MPADGDNYSTARIQAVLDFVLDSVGADERPYLQVEILGVRILGLLDTGASKTILGGKGWKLIQHLALSLVPSDITSVRLANGQACTSWG